MHERGIGTIHEVIHNYRTSSAFQLRLLERFELRCAVRDGPSPWLSVAAAAAAASSVSSALCRFLFLFPFPPTVLALGRLLPFAVVLADFAAGPRRALDGALGRAVGDPGLLWGFDTLTVVSESVNSKTESSSGIPGGCGAEDASPD